MIKIGVAVMVVYDHHHLALRRKGTAKQNRRTTLVQNLFIAYCDRELHNLLSKFDLRAHCSYMKGSL
jgi:hypothetical protein